MKGVEINLESNGEHMLCLSFDFCIYILTPKMNVLLNQLACIIHMCICVYVYVHIRLLRKT